MKRLSAIQSAGVIAIVAIVVLPCFAGQVAVLKNGFSIRNVRHAVIGNVTRLYVSADGSSFVDVATDQIDHFEDAPDLPAPDPHTVSGSRIPASGGLASSASMGFPGRPKTDLSQVVNDASGRYRLDPDLVNSVIKAESGFNARAVSPKGAQGLMQLMPGTASQLGVPNAFDAAANVEGGTKYLRQLMELYNFDIVKALAAYNAGPQRVRQFGGVPPYYETRTYVRRVVKDFNRKKLAEQKAAAAAKAASAKKAAAKKTAPVRAASTKNHVAAAKHTSNTAVQAKSSQPNE